MEIGNDRNSYSAITPIDRYISEYDDKSQSGICSSPYFAFSALASIFLFFAIMVGSTISKGINIEMWPGDTRRLSDMNTLLRSHIQLSYPSSNIRVYYVTKNQHPPLEAFDHIYEERRKLKLKPKEYQDYSFFLNEGSNLTINFRSNQVADLYLFKGVSNFHDWQSRYGYRSWMFQQSTFSNTTYKLRRMIDSPDTYYLVFLNVRQDYQVEVEYDLSLYRTEYQLSNHIPFCDFGLSSCSLSLDILGKAIPVLQMPKEIESVSTESRGLDGYVDGGRGFEIVNVKGLPRWNFIMVVFFLIPMIISICVYVLHEQYKSEIEENNRFINELSSSEFSSLLNSPDGAIRAESFAIPMFPERRTLSSPIPAVAAEVFSPSYYGCESYQPPSSTPVASVVPTSSYASLYTRR